MNCNYLLSNLLAKFLLCLASLLRKCHGSYLRAFDYRSLVRTRTPPLANPRARVHTSFKKRFFSTVPFQNLPVMHPTKNTSVCLQNYISPPTGIYRTSSFCGIAYNVLTALTTVAIILPVYSQTTVTTPFFTSTTKHTSLTAWSTAARSRFTSQQHRASTRTTEFVDVESTA